MAPKKQTTPNKKSADADVIDVEIPGESTEVWARIKDNVLTISDRFKKIVTCNPIGLDSTGAFQASFQLEHYRNSITSLGKYQCGLNMAWLDFNYCAMPGVPIRQQAIDEMREQYFAAGPCHMPKAIVIAVADATFNPLEHKGSLQRVSPGEAVYALLEAIRLDIDAKKDADVQKWKQVLLTTTGVFEVLPTFEDKWW